MVKNKLPPSNDIGLEEVKSHLFKGPVKFKSFIKKVIKEVLKTIDSPEFRWKISVLSENSHTSYLGGVDSKSTLRFSKFGP